MSWAIYQEGKAADWLRQDLAAALRPHLASGTSAKLVPAKRRVASSAARRVVRSKRQR